MARSVILFKQRARRRIHSGIPGQVPSKCKMLITISNRLPVSVSKKGESLLFESSVGGLATGLAQFYKTSPSAWVGWPGISRSRINAREMNVIRNRLRKESCYPVHLTRYEVENYYHGFANKTIWPLFHYFPLYASYNKTYWTTYKSVNEKFASTVSRIIRPGDKIWVHDYHLLLLPKILRKRHPDATIGFFLHIPFPSFELFRLLPWREEILRGLLGADLIGFHTHSYARHFLQNVSQILDIEHSQWQIPIEKRTVKIDAFPMGIDFIRFATASSSLKIQREADNIRKKFPKQKIIVSVDRLDYTKGISNRLDAFALFLEQNSNWRKKVTLILIAVPSRTAVPVYAQLKRIIDELVGRINGRFGSLGWTPILYLYRALPFESLAAHYLAADVALVTPLRDGMNLIAKEYLAARHGSDGVLILSEMAGAAQELNDAILVNPNNSEQMADAIREALCMTPEAQLKRNHLMRRRVENYTVTRWAHHFLAELVRSKKNQKELQSQILDEKNRKSLLTSYRKAKKRLLLLDYDGSLVHFATKPKLAQPDQWLVKVLRRLSLDPRNMIVIASGRDAQVLEKWFGSLNLGLIAEHGALIKGPKGEWTEIESLRENWKYEVHGLLQDYADRTPGAFMEEKKYSLVWHYSKVDNALADFRTRELKSNLKPLIAGRGLEILEGNKVLEVHNAGVSKSRAALRFLQERKWDFILSLGDDRTDEDIFAVLPASAYSLRVGIEPTCARFNLEGIEASRRLLIELGTV
jgi:trehalose 6-phosphate synthase/phosphatase